MVTISFKRMIRRVRRFWRLLRGKEPRVRVSNKWQTIFVGSSYGGWGIIPSILDENSIVYSLGVGKDISFDLGLIEKFHLTVYAFDPTPASIEWVKSRALPENFIMHEFGVSDYTGNLHFREPENPEHISHSAVDLNKESQNTIQLPVRTLTQITNELGHDYIDILKMDIEGSEYAVLQQLNEWEFDVKVLLVEFHHRFLSVSTEKTQSAIAELEENGFIVFWMSDSGEEMGFINTGLMD